MVAHEMDTRQIEVSGALRALRRMEQPWMVRIGQVFDLLKFRCRLEPIRRRQLLVLGAPISKQKKKKQTPRENWECVPYVPPRAQYVYAQATNP